MLSAIRETMVQCLKVCSDVEFVADDATRSDPAFLYQVISAAIEAGAKTITVCDTAGTMLQTFEAVKDAVGLDIPRMLRDVTTGGLVGRAAAEDAPAANHEA